MRAMLLQSIGSLAANPEPLVLADVDDPVPADDEILIRVAACGVCHTELDEIEGRTPPPELPVIPGHEVVGRVVAAGRNACRFRLGDRVGVGWIHSSDGTESENISPAFRATGRDVDGGYAELLTVPEAYAAPVPEAFTSMRVAMEPKSRRLPTPSAATWIERYPVFPASGSRISVAFPRSTFPPDADWM